MGVAVVAGVVVPLAGRKASVAGTSAADTAQDTSDPAASRRSTDQHIDRVRSHHTSPSLDASKLQPRRTIFYRNIYSSSTLLSSAISLTIGPLDFTAADI